MGASRYNSAGYAAGGSTALLERGLETRPSRTTTTPKPAGLRPRPHVPRGPRRLGSKQVVSVRGRRVAASTETKRKFSRMSILSVPLLLLGIFGAMLLSALSTQQTFTIQQLQSEERVLSNEIETLNRNVEDARSAAQVAAQADAAGMIVPGQPGIIAVDDKGAAHETRPADSKHDTRVVDVNRDSVRSERSDSATSDRSATRDVADNLSALPGSANGEQPAVAPSAALPSLPGSR